MVSFTTLLALSAGALSSPVVQRQIAIPENWNWHVSGWEAGCARSGCYYNFNVTVPTVEGQIAGVKAYCNGYENGYYRKGNWYENCQILEGVNNGVAAKLSERPPESDTESTLPQEILISFVLAGYEDRPAYNFTGSHKTIYNQFAAPLQEFDVTPTTVFGVA
ncbi:hypothetical protein DPSP01_000672 [Paraphaeosphaeria sporulosa]|uniref:Uncharacterized protein n=1 Tax=Paraphaeosphaeria sporulosa TaxID=1460663 RepID=A0A177CRP4_9PLEO|nr:uncharacterized protein CC84DRAFT_1213023 [Paraphaeosphaeria sporulosa]OAG09612.1 hypothetical protein CC84DRAFT_1213023 [Paraphaeosphaeria sporulosa]